jgi:hypothetical protein
LPTPEAVSRVQRSPKPLPWAQKLQSLRTERYSLACEVLDHLLLVAARGRIVLGDQLGLRRDDLRELGLQRLGYALMVLLARAPQQRLIRCSLDQRMLEDVRRLRRELPCPREGWS